MSCSRPLIKRGKWDVTVKRSYWYVLPIIKGGGSGSGVVLKFSTLCPQQLMSSLGSHSEGSMGLRGLFGKIDPFERVATSTVSTTNLECRSVGRNEESPAVMTLCLNLGWIHSWTMTRMRQVSIPFLVVPWQESVLQHAAESTLMLTPDNIRGQLVETPCGPGLTSDFVLELTIPLLVKDGGRILSLVPD